MISIEEMRKGQVCLLTLLVLFSMMGLYSLGILATEAKGGAPTPHTYVVFAQGGKVEADHNDPTHALLSLTGLDGYVVYFAEDPSQKEGSLPIKAFLEKWSVTESGGFGQERPIGALLTYDDESSQSHQVSMVLSNPTYDASLNELMFDVVFIQKPLEGTVILEQTTLYVREQPPSQVQ